MHSASSEPGARTAQTTPAGEVAIQVTATVSGPAAPDSPVRKVVVAVHGVGDQYSFATIQAVVNQFCQFYDQPAGVPLGFFHADRKAVSLPEPYPRDPFERFAFAEVYWAKIPREVASEMHTLEESKKWARTLVERLRLRWRIKGSKGGCADRDFNLIKQVLSELIQTVAVLDRICYLGERAGLFTFDLRKLLDDYLGDVQIVTEFKPSRDTILNAFRDVLQDVNAAYPNADIYVVAHSEGTVVSLLGLIEAFRAPEPPNWAASVRGFMTIGSPIDKHLILWPELFGEGPPRHLPVRPIEWHNYYDQGDPIGFSLHDARAWLQVQRWESVFNLPRGHDHGFTRYPLPGKAHVDYWNDEAVFGHFITTVVGESPKQSGAALGADRTQPPQDLKVKKWLSYILPYVGVTALLFVAVYILYKAVVEAIAPEPLPASARRLQSLMIFRDVARNALVLFGVTVAARLPRLTRSRWLRTFGLAVAAAACAVYYVTAPDVGPTAMWGLTIPPGVSTVVLATIMVALAFVFGTLFPTWGVTPLMLSGALVVAGKVGYHVVWLEADTGPIWPVFIAAAAFLYLWWLAALLFDLVVIWHWYIRQGQIVAGMDELMGGRPGARDREVPPVDYAPQVQT